ncbi:MAG: GNAT family N-acetyltransferase [Rhodobacteraceae bacterium]|nr:GNAT family N-acetyltransferase [Paracoccaceae bacterium]
MSGIQTGYHPALIGEITAAHARYYAKNWGFGQPFETKVASECAGFMAHITNRDLVLSAWEADRFLGSMIIDGSDPNAAPNQAHLRWFITVQSGRGLGRKMMQQAMEFIDQTGSSCYLTTFRGLDPARRLYEDFGFELVEETETLTWGKTVSEQRFERPAQQS